MRTTADADGITSTYSVGPLLVTQRIELVNNASSEQLGTAQILYTVENLSDKEQTVKSRLLMDTMLGEQDYGLYEAGNGYLGDGFQGYVTETMLDGGEEGSRIPADYFVQNSMAESTIAAFGVNSTLKTEKPYRMIFAHWAIWLPHPLTMRRTVDLTLPIPLMSGKQRILPQPSIMIWVSWQQERKRPFLPIMV